MQPPDAKSPAIHAEPAFLKGFVEIQDEGSQLAALLSGAKEGEQVIDLCAGAGGKTLALAAMMDNHGQLYATDTDKRRLAPIHARLDRAGARNVQVRTPRASEDTLADLHGKADLVLIDAPCTGTGAWRRNPDAKWRVRPNSLATRVEEQAETLDRAAALVKPGGRIVYVTCSVLDDENGAQVRAFAARHPEFAVVPPLDVAGALGERAFLFRRAILASDAGLLMTPRRTDTDGFFVSVLDESALTLSKRGLPMSTISRRQIVGGAVTATIAGVTPSQAAPAPRARGMVDVCVVGAGFAGLSAAYRLRQAGLNVVVLEARQRVGGRSLSIRMKDGTFIDFGGQWVGSSQSRFYDVIKEMGGADLSLARWRPADLAARHRRHQRAPSHQG